MHGIIPRTRRALADVSMNPDTGDARRQPRYTVREPCRAKIDLDIKRIGAIRTRVVRPLIGGVAVEFIFDKDKDRRLIGTLRHVLNEFASTSHRASDRHSGRRLPPRRARDRPARPTALSGRRPATIRRAFTNPKGFRNTAATGVRDPGVGDSDACGRAAAPRGVTATP